MENILVISYRFPPADETGTQRTWALAQYLKENGYYPIFITRNWDRKLLRYEDSLLPSGSEIQHIITENFENYILPFRNSLKLRLNRKKKGSIVTRLYNFLDYILMYFGYFGLNQYSAFEKQAIQVAKRNTIKKAIVITDPYPLFFIGYRLNKRLGVKWIADYRDDWTTREVSDTYGFNTSWFHKLTNWLFRQMEKKWVGTATLLTSVSPEYTKRPSELVGIPGVTVYNGYFEELIPTTLTSQPLQKNQKTFHIVHSGTLYPLQQIEPFLNAFKRIVDEYRGKIDLKVSFYGITYKKGSVERINKAMQGYEQYYECTDRISQRELFDHIIRAQMTLVIAFGKAFKGVTPSKIFDYIALKTPVLCCFPDNDIVEDILTKTNLGIFCENEEQIYKAIDVCICNHVSGVVDTRKPNEEIICQFSRRSQVKVVADLLNKL